MKKLLGIAAFFAVTGLMIAGCKTSTEPPHVHTFYWTKGTLKSDKERVCSSCQYREKIEKTSETEVITQTATIKMEDDSSWSGYISSTDSDFCRGVFIKGRSVTLSPFAMGRYEVTQELFEAVMGTNPSYCLPASADYKNMLAGETQKLRPVENVNWYHAIAFCNKLSILEGLDVCYSVKVNSVEIDWEHIAFDSIPMESDSDWDAAKVDMTKKGYRLPTEAEWEFAARGGDAASGAWKYSYAGVNTAKTPSKFNAVSPYNDTKLDNYGWYRCNLAGGESTSSSTLSKGAAGYGTHEAGLKKPVSDTLELYDMSGNVSEWCWDWHGTVSTESVTDPADSGPSSERILRGGSWKDSACFCSVSYRSTNYPGSCGKGLGLRLARSL